MRRAPAFWRDDGLPARLLSPLGDIYGAVARERMARAALHAALPAIVVGGLTAGGDGKTPLAIALAERLATRGHRPALLTRGYGRGTTDALIVVDPATHDADHVGDEALLLARAAMTIVGVDRLASAALAKSLGASIVVLDDGLHSARVAPDLALLAIDSDYGAGNGRCLPAGPLRAPLDAQFAAADMLVVIGNGPLGAALVEKSGRPALGTRREPAEHTVKGVKVVAFAGIARPESFFRTLAETGAEIVASRGFADHHRFTLSELDALATLRDKLGAVLVTTEKDAARLGPTILQEVNISVLPARLVFDEPGALDAVLNRVS